MWQSLRPSKQCKLHLSSWQIFWGNCNCWSFFNLCWMSFPNLFFFCKFFFRIIFVIFGNCCCGQPFRKLSFKMTILHIVLLENTCILTVRKFYFAKCDNFLQSGFPFVLTWSHFHLSSTWWYIYLRYGPKFWSSCCWWDRRFAGCWRWDRRRREPG